MKNCQIDPDSEASRSNGLAFFLAAKFANECVFALKLPFLLLSGTSLRAWSEKYLKKYSNFS
jgi:hypothetical protein